MKVDEEMKKGVNKNPENEQVRRYRMGTLNERIVTLTNKFRTHENERKDNKEKIKQLEAKNKVLNQQISELRGHKDEYMKQLEDLSNYKFDKEDVDKLKAEKDELLKTVNKLKTELLDATETVSEITEDIEEV